MDALEAGENLLEFIVLPFIHRFRLGSRISMVSDWMPGLPPPTAYTKFFKEAAPRLPLCSSISLIYNSSSSIQTPGRASQRNLSWLLPQTSL